MARLYLVRHGKAAAGWDADPDPGLYATGLAQAEAMAAALAPKGPLPLVTSPLRRTRETAAPLERLWRVSARIEPDVAEIPSPTADLAQRSEWLRAVMRQSWSEQEPWLAAWRAKVLATLAAIETDTVVVSHFIAINVAVGRAMGDDRAIVFRPENASCTVLDVTDGMFRLVELGTEGASRIL
ncbi:MAG TPA: histidine phosphatase family protein [Aliidongia sp.]|nr:histidine phosphatase family protein [Aliidongia sp.]